MIIKPQNNSLEKFKIIPQNLDIVLRGVNVHFKDWSLEEVLNFHTSGNAHELREALHKFETNSKNIITQNISADSAVNEYVLSAERLERKVEEVGKDLSTFDFQNKLSKTSKHPEYGIRFGGVVLGGAIGALSQSPIVGSSVGALLLGGTDLLNLILERLDLKDKMIRKFIDYKFYPGLSNLWSIINKK